VVVLGLPLVTSFVSISETALGPAWLVTAAPCARLPELLAQQRFIEEVESRPYKQADRLQILAFVS